MKKLTSVFLLASLMTLFSGCLEKYPSYKDRKLEAHGYVSAIEDGMKKSVVREKLSELDRRYGQHETPNDFDVTVWGEHIILIFEFSFPDSIYNDKDWLSKHCSSFLVYHYQYFGREKEFYEGKGSFWKNPDRLAIYFDKDEKVIGWSYEVDKH